MKNCLDDAKKSFNPNSLWDKIIFPFTHKNWWHIRKKTIGTILDKHIQNAELKTIISTFWIYYLLPPSKLSGFIYLLATGMFMVETVQILRILLMLLTVITSEVFQTGVYLQSKNFPLL